MRVLWRALRHFLVAAFRGRLSLQLEIVALRHQLSVYERSRPRRFRIEPGDRALWSWLARLWPEWRDRVRFVQPRTVLEWQKRRFREHWRRKSEGQPGRPAIDPEIRALIRQISRANPSWGSPRIVGELAKLGIFEILYVLIVLAHERRRIVHFNVTAHPTAHWTAQQMVEAFPFDTAPRYLLRDRDSIYGAAFRRRVRSLDIEEVLTAPRSPWQNPYAERLIGTLRRECLDNVIVLHERHLCRILWSYVNFYHRWRVHQSLEMDAPEHRPVQPPELGEVIEFPDVAGLQRHYERCAA